MSAEELIVDVDGLRLDQFLARRFPRLSRTHLKGLVERGCVLLDGRAGAPDVRVEAGQSVRVEFPDARWSSEEEAFDGWVLHEDNDLLVLDKPAGLLMHPLGTSWLSTPRAAFSELEPNLAGLLQRLRPEIARREIPRCGIVHRLDRQTSGVLLVAKTRAAFEALTRAFQERRVEKTYRAVVRGRFPERRARVEAPIGRKPGHRRVIVTPFGKTAQTEFAVIESAPGAALVEARPLTGRTHQIRAHLALLGHPVAGDVEFDRGAGAPRPPRLMLHAFRVIVEHPRTEKAAEFEAPLPADFRSFWRACRQRR